MYFPKNNKTDWKVERHRMNILTLKWGKLKEFGYIPTHTKVINGTVTEKNDKYYVSMICDIVVEANRKIKTKAIGIDLGLKEFARCSNNLMFKNISKTHVIKKLEKKLKREKRR